MTTGWGEPGEWNGQHFKSPSILDFGDYLLMAMEGWSDYDTVSGIGLMIGIERWLKAQHEVIVIGSAGGGLSQPAEIQLGSYGAGDLVIDHISVSGDNFTLTVPPLPITVEPSETIRIPVMYTPDPDGNPVTGTVTVHSNAQLGNRLEISLLGN